MNVQRTIWKSLGLAILALLLGQALGFWQATRTPASLDNSTTTFTIEEGQGPRKIADNLRSQKLLLSKNAFFIYIILTQKTHRFYPGSYEIQRNVTMTQLVRTLTNSKARLFSVRVVEGWRITDIAKEVAKQTKVTKVEFEATAPVGQYEGYLFPDTYYFGADTTAAEIVATMRKNFDKRTASLGTLTSDQVKLASIIEREAKNDDDRSQIAGLYMNRLKLGMPLQADPTIQYAKGSWAPITLADYKDEISPYNTYLNAGLPPTPISNPGLKSLEAAAHPATNNYYYFFNLADGTTIYSKTLAEHSANKAKYLK